MPDLPNEETERWVRFWVKSVREDSTVRKLKRADRCLFYEYIALARWQPSPPRLRGCLCDPDGRGWTRAERAEAVGETYATIKRAEEEMEAAGLITFHESAASHHSSKGRLRIVNYDRYQGGMNGEEAAFNSEGCSSDQPSILKADAFKSEGRNSRQPSNLKAGSDEETAFNSEGCNSESASGPKRLAIESDEETAFSSEGKPPVEVNDVNDVEERQEPARENDNGSNGHPLAVRQELWGQFQELAVGGMPDKQRRMIEPQFERTPAEIAIDAAVVAVAKRQGRPFDWTDLAEHVVNIMQLKLHMTRGNDGEKPSTRMTRDYGQLSCERTREDSFGLLDYYVDIGNWPGQNADLRLYDEEAWVREGWPTRDLQQQREDITKQQEAGYGNTGRDW